MPIIPPKEEDDARVATSVRLPGSLVRELDEAAKTTGRTRNEVIEFALRWAMQEVRREMELLKAEKPNGSHKPKRKD